MFFPVDDVTVDHRCIEINKRNFTQSSLFHIMLRHILRQEGIIVAVHKEGDDFHAVINLQLELMVLWKELTYILSDILKGKITHQIL